MHSARVKHRMQPCACKLLAQTVWLASGLRNEALKFRNVTYTTHAVCWGARCRWACCRAADEPGVRVPAGARSQVERMDALDAVRE